MAWWSTTPSSQSKVRSLGGGVKVCRERDRTAETKPLLLSLSLTYHSQSVALALLDKTVLSLWEREKPGSLTYFFSSA